MIGASGDQMPIYRTARYAVENYGTWWYVYSWPPVGPVPLDTAYDWGAPIAAEVPIYIGQIGGGVFSGRPKLSTGTADYIKKHSPFPITFTLKHMLSCHS